MNRILHISMAGVLEVDVPLQGFRERPYRPSLHGLIEDVLSGGWLPSNSDNFRAAPHLAHFTRSS